MKYKVTFSSKIRKQLKKIIKRKKDIKKFQSVVSLLAFGYSLPEKCRDHQLSGDLKGYRDCHIEPDWILIYTIKNDNLILFLLETGTHSALF